MTEKKKPEEAKINKPEELKAKPGKELTVTEAKPEAKAVAVDEHQRKAYEGFKKHMAEKNQVGVFSNGTAADIKGLVNMGLVCKGDGLGLDLHGRRNVVRGYLEGVLSGLNSEYEAIFAEEAARLKKEGKSEAEIAEEMFHTVLGHAYLRTGIDQKDAMGAVEAMKFNGATQAITGLRINFLREDKYQAHVNEDRWNTSYSHVDSPLAWAQLIRTDKAFTDHFEEPMKNGIFIKRSHRQTLDAMLNAEKSRTQMAEQLGIAYKN